MGRFVLVVACLLLAGPAEAERVRLFAVGHKQRLEDAASYAAYRSKMAAMMDAAFPGREGLVQAGVDDVASHLRPADPDAPERALVVFPESAGLLAAFIGSRGALARSQTRTDGAILSLLFRYEAPFQHYAAKFPDQPSVRILIMALTDTLYRGFYETFRDLALRHGVYLAVSADLCPARRVEAAEAPALVALLRDPDEPERSYAYEAVSPFAVNTTFVFAPDGAILVPDGRGGTLRSPQETGGVLRGSTDKAYLTPIEQPPPSEPLGLALSFGAVRDQEVLDTPVGRLGIVISKDAWMVDVNDRLAAKGANVILQPEAFDSWAFSAEPWSPDVFKAGGFANVTRNPEFRINVNASLTGNLFDVTFDGQSSIQGPRQKRPPGPLAPSNAWIGQNPDTGFRAVAPWILPDPGLAASGLSLAARRAALAAQGVKLLPGSAVPCGGNLVVGPCENGYREAVVWTDIELPDGARTGPVDPVRQRPPHFEPAVRVSGPEPVATPQRNPQVTARGRRVYVVWQEARGHGLENVFLAVSHDAGRSFGSPVRVSDNPPGAVAELFPAVAVRGGRVLVVWQEFASGRDDDRGRIVLARFAPNGDKRGRDVRVDDRDDSGKWMPTVAFVGPRPFVAWVDERDRGPEGEPLEHVYAALGTPNGRFFGPSLRVDSGRPVPLATHLDHEWAPAVAVDDQRVYVSWSDFQNYNWDVFLARSDDGGRSFRPAVRVDDFPDFERIHERPSVAVGRGGRVHVAWTDLRAREPDTNVFHARSDDRGRRFSRNAPLDDSRRAFDPDRDTPSNQWHPSLVAAGDRVFATWQDDRLGNNDVFFAHSRDGGETFGPAERVDDTGGGASAQTRPRLALGGSRPARVCLVVFEDDRNGNPDVYLARRRCG